MECNKRWFEDPDMAILNLFLVHLGNRLGGISTKGDVIPLFIKYVIRKLVILNNLLFLIYRLVRPTVVKSSKL